MPCPCRRCSHLATYGTLRHVLWIGPETTASLTLSSHLEKLAVMPWRRCGQLCLRLQAPDDRHSATGPPQFRVERLLEPGYHIQSHTCLTRGLDMGRSPGPDSLQPVIPAANADQTLHPFITRCPHRRGGYKASTSPLSKSFSHWAKFLGINIGAWAGSAPAVWRPFASRDQPNDVPDESRRS